MFPSAGIFPHSKPASPVEQSRDDIPSGLSEIIARMMAWDSTDRISTPAKVAKLLDPFTADANLERLVGNRDAEKPFAEDSFVCKERGNLERANLESRNRATQSSLFSGGRFLLLGFALLLVSAAGISTTTECLI